MLPVIADPSNEFGDTGKEIKFIVLAIVSDL